MLIIDNRTFDINEGFNIFEIDSDNDVNITLDIDIRCNIFFRVINASKIIINGNITNLVSIVFWNDSNKDLETIENYNVLDDSDLTLAYCECNDYKTNRDLNVYLKGLNSKSLISSASLVNTNKQYRINQVNSGIRSFGDIKNYAVVLDSGKLMIDAIGKIEKGAKKARSHQTSRALCFGENQNSTILPELLIDENDVQASHAMSIGRVDDKQLYYMMSRGLTMKQCTSLISLGYLLPIVEYIADEKLKELLQSQLESKLSNV